MNSTSAAARSSKARLTWNGPNERIVTLEVHGKPWSTEQQAVEERTRELSDANIIVQNSPTILYRLRGEGFRRALQQAGLYDPDLELLTPRPSSVGLGGELFLQNPCSPRCCRWSPTFPANCPKASVTGACSKPCAPCSPAMPPRTVDRWQR